MHSKNAVETKKMEMLMKMELLANRRGNRAKAQKCSFVT